MIVVAGECREAERNRMQSSRFLGEVVPSGVRATHDQSQSRERGLALESEDWFQRWTRQAVETVDHQQNAHREAKNFRIDCCHKRGADRNTECAANDEWHDRPPFYGMTNPPDAGTLRDKSAQDDEKRVLLRSDNVQPHTGDNEAHCEARQA